MEEDNVVNEIERQFRFFEREIRLAEKVSSQIQMSASMGQIEKELSEFAAAQKLWATQLQDVMSTMVQPYRQAQKMFESFRIPTLPVIDLSALDKALAYINRMLQQDILSAMEGFFKTYEELPPRLQKALLQLGEYGWYLDMQMPFGSIPQLLEAFAEGNMEEAEAAMVEYFEGRLDGIEESITREFPHRAHLIRAAFVAHRRGEYVLSIPVLLAQVDGICEEVFRGSFFTKRNGKPKTAWFVEQIVLDDFQAALLAPLTQTLPINVSQHERPAGSHALNRHTVLHGEALDYGSKVNSLKAISLINYVAHVTGEWADSIDDVLQD